jgi:hypothetical protein
MKGEKETAQQNKKGRKKEGKPVESSSPLEWPARGGQLGLAAVSLLYSLS